ncbi:MAG: M20/M25/M40 family metallo-hydrolase [Pseudomonadota bacterium]
MQQPVTTGEDLKKLIAGICDEAGPRPAGSASEEKAARLIAKKLEALGAETSVEEFFSKPRAIHSLLVSTVFFTAASFGLYFVWPPASLASAAAVVAIFFSMPILGSGRDIASLWIRKARSWNVCARLKPQEEARKLLVFSGHHDSAFRMPILSPRLFRLVFILLPLFVTAVMVLLGLSGWKTWGLYFSAPGGAAMPRLLETILLCVSGAGVLSAAVLLAGMIRNDTVMGANDNLSGVAVALGVVRELADDRPRRTEVMAVSFGSEEAGLIGSREFAKRHAKELRSAVLINLDGIGQSGTLRLITGELMAAARHDKKAVDLAARAAEASGIKIQKNFLWAGETDAASFSKKGLSAASFLRLNEKNFLDCYHNPGDNVQSLREESLQEALALCLEIVRQADRG